jgi:putative ubiquitin-RnfH superfamily antitoxin RatB of RatAB toxin-antitoxin module
MGSIRFAAYVADDGTIQWRFVHSTGTNSRKRHWKDAPLTEETQVDFPAAAVAEMRRLSETMHEKPDNAWFFSALGAVDMETEDRVRKERDLQRTVEVLAPLLADPSEPRQHFVPAAEAGTPKGYHRDATAEERAERRAMWTERHDKAVAALAALTEAQADRLAMLRRLKVALHDWSHRKGAAPRPSAYQVYQAAIAA